MSHVKFLLCGSLLDAYFISTLCDIIVKKDKAYDFWANPFPKLEVGLIMRSSIYDFKVSIRGFLVSPFSFCRAISFNDIVLSEGLTLFFTPRGGLFIRSYDSLLRWSMRQFLICLEEVPCLPYITYLSRAGGFLILISPRRTHDADIPQGGPISFYVLKADPMSFLCFAGRILVRPLSLC